MSNGAVFSLHAARSCPQCYAAVLAFSHGPREILDRPANGWSRLPAHFLAAGRLEPRFLPVLQALADSLRRAGVPMRLQIHPGGHDNLAWEELFVRAVSWWLSGGR